MDCLRVLQWLALLLNKVICTIVEDIPAQVFTVSIKKAQKRGFPSTLRAK